MDPRTFLIGCMTGIFMVIGSFIAVSALGGIKWQPVMVQR